MFKGEHDGKEMILQGLEEGQRFGRKHFFPLTIWLRVISAEDLVSFVSNMQHIFFPTCNLT